ncbi:MAG: hypothetical protein WHV26_09395 [Spirochaetota bacterium]
MQQWTNRSMTVDPSTGFYKLGTLAEVPVSGDHGGRAFIVAADDLASVDFLARGELQKAESVDDHQRNINIAEKCRMTN